MLNFMISSLAGGYDFLVTGSVAPCEVECKHVSADIGRQIHRIHLHQLQLRIGPLLSRVVEEFGSRHIQITIPARLKGDGSKSRRS